MVKQVRADRLATLSVFLPLLRSLPWAKGGIPILMYHSIAEKQENRVHPYYETTTAPDVFAGQMEFLYENGYTTISLGEAVDRLNECSASSRKVVVITFDDGFQDFYTTAFPILRRYRFRATVFLPTAFIGEGSIQFKGTSCLTWSHIRQLHSQGVSFGSHSVSHARLEDLTTCEVERELRCSKQVLEDALGTSIDSFSYPYAFPEANSAFAEEFAYMLQQAGYRIGVTTIIGTARPESNAFRIPRLPINSADDRCLFSAKLEGAYDWMHTPQYMMKLLSAGITMCAKPHRQAVRS